MLALEPEAASIYVKEMDLQVHKDLKDMRTSENYVVCATRINVCRSMSLIKRLTLIFVKK